MCLGQLPVGSPDSQHISPQRRRQFSSMCRQRSLRSEWVRQRGPSQPQSEEEFKELTFLSYFWQTNSVIRSLPCGSATSHQMVKFDPKLNFWDMSLYFYRPERGEEPCWTLSPQLNPFRGEQGKMTVSKRTSFWLLSLKNFLTLESGSQNPAILKRGSPMWAVNFQEKRSEERTSQRERVKASFHLLSNTNLNSLQEIVLLWRRKEISEEKRKLWWLRWVTGRKLPHVSWGEISSSFGDSSVERMRAMNSGNWKNQYGA